MTPSFVLKDVLHVPKLAANLVSIQKITKDLKCHVNFYPSNYIFLGIGFREED